MLARLWEQLDGEGREILVVVVDKVTEIDWRRAVALDDQVTALREQRAASSGRN